MLLILAGISIATLTGPNGVLEKSNKAKEEMKKAQYLEELRVIGLGLQPDRTMENWDNQTYMNKYQDEIQRDDMFLDAKEIKQLPNTEEITIQVITVEGWVYWITEEKVEYKGTEDEQHPIEPEEPVIKPTGIYAALVGNTLKFYTTQEAAEASGGKTYENVQGKIFTRDNTDNVEKPNTPWFADADNITAVEFVDEVAPEYLEYYFSDLKSLETVNMEKVKTINVTNMYGMFLNCEKLREINTKGFDTRNVENMGWMFLNCKSLTSLDVTMFDTKKVTNMEVMFNGCSSLTQLDVSNFDTSNVTTMRSMFANCTGLSEINLSNFNTSNVTNMATMFHGCSAIRKLDLSNFDTSKVTIMDSMFNLCMSLTDLDVSSFNTSNVTSMKSMFSNLYGIRTLDVSSFNTDQVINMYKMFNGCSSLTILDLSNFDTRNVTDMTSMFQYGLDLKTIYIGPNWKTASKNTNMFLDCATSKLTLK